MVASRVLLLLLLPLLAGGVLSPVRPARQATLSRAATSFSPTPRKAATLPLRIDGQWYDLTDWADEHPGGAYSQPERSGAARKFCFSRSSAARYLLIFSERSCVSPCRSLAA